MNRTKLLALLVYAAAMGLFEAATVIYLRRLLSVGFGGEAVPQGLTWLSLRPVELSRETATIVMILMAALLFGRSWRGRLGAFAFVFGIWDLSYYVFMNVFTGWPGSLLNWDLLFLIPSPWWGPVLAPVLIALVLVIGGIRWMQPAIRPHRGWVIYTSGMILVGGAALLSVFLTSVPPHFAWWAYLPALALFSAGVLSA